MSDLAKTKMACSSFCVLPFKFTGYRRLDIKHALRAKIGQGDPR